MIRVSEQVRDRAVAMAAEANVSVNVVVSRALRLYEQKAFLAGLAADFDRVYEDPSAKDEHVSEREEWESALPDRLEPPA